VASLTSLFKTAFMPPPNLSYTLSLEDFSPFSLLGVLFVYFVSISD
jgi:hypothetical protein